jgi:hypothetical protein
LYEELLRLDLREAGRVEKPPKPEKKPFSPDELFDFADVLEHFGKLLDDIIVSALINDEMKVEVENLDQIARWEAVGKVSKAMTDTLSILGSPSNIMQVAFDWFGMQEGKSIPKKRRDEILGSRDIEEIS